MKRKLHDVKCTLKDWYNRNWLKTCSIATGVTGSALAMIINVGAEGYTYSVDTVATDIFSLAKSALDFCLSNQAMATIFTISLIGMIFGIVRKAKRAVK